MYQLTGEHECKIDAKGRIKIPSSLAQELGFDTLRFTINRGFEKHLMLYPQAVWEKKTNEINQLSIYKSKQRQAIRYFYRGASKVTMDNQGRLLLPKSLIEYAGIEKEVILFAYQEQIEVWSKKEYQKMCDMEPEDFAEIADEIFGDSQEADIDK